MVHLVFQTARLVLCDVRQASRRNFYQLIHYGLEIDISVVKYCKLYFYQSVRVDHDPFCWILCTFPYFIIIHGSWPLRHFVNFPKFISKWVDYLHIFFNTSYFITIREWEDDLLYCVQEYSCSISWTLSKWVWNDKSCLIPCTLPFWKWTEIIVHYKIHRTAWSHITVVFKCFVLPGQPRRTFSWPGRLSCRIAATTWSNIHKNCPPKLQ